MVGLLILAACAPTGGPRLSFAQRVHALGSVSANQQTEYRLVFTNSGGRALEIAEVRLEPVDPASAGPSEP